MKVPDAGEYEDCSNTMKVSKLKEILQNYPDDDDVVLRLWGMTDYPSLELIINNDIIMSDDW